jgi:hypothetical protein
VHGLITERLRSPRDKNRHLAGSAEWRAGLKRDTEIFAVGVACGDIVGKSFVFASVALILGGVFQKVAVQLPEDRRLKCPFQ